MTNAGNGVYYSILKDPDIAVRGELFPALVPQAAIITVASPYKEGKWAIKVRAGLLFPTGKSILDLNLPNLGGRWDAGNTKRSGGYPGNPLDFIHLIVNGMNS